MKKIWCKIFGHRFDEEKIWYAGRRGKNARLLYNVYQAPICSRCGLVGDKTKIRSGLTKVAAELFVKNYGER